MPQEPDEPVEGLEPGDEAAETRRSGVNWKRALLALPALFGLLLAYGWYSREEIADNFVASQLENLNLPATYKIESIGAGRQVLSDVVIGDPDNPDLTIERLIVRLRARVGLSAIGGVTLVRPRLYGSYRGGKLSFGSLDPLLFKETGEPFRLPDLDLAIVDGRALIASDFGPVGIKVQGEGILRGGFEGELAAVAPKLTGEGCEAGRTTLYGKVSVADEHPRIAGPLRLSRLACPRQGLRLAGTGFELDFSASKTLDEIEGTIGLNNAGAGLGNVRAAGLGGTLRLVYREDSATARYDLTVRKATAPQVGIASLRFNGRMRALDGLARVELEGDLSGKDLALGRDIDASMANLASGAQATLVGDLAGAILGGLRREQGGSSLKGGFIVRRAGQVTSVVIPRASVRGASGETLLALSRIQVRAGGSALPSVSGNFSTGGRDLPRIAGRMERVGDGPMRMRVRMPDYRAGSARLALPHLLVVQSANGAFGFAGEALVSGALPGGLVEDLAVPLEGNWSGEGGLSLWRKCVQLRFVRLELANAAIAKRSLPVCPPRGGAIVRSTSNGFKVAGGIPALDLAGTLGGTQIRIASGPIGFAWPGVLNAKAIDVSLGPAESASSFRVAKLQARLGGELAGTFAETEVRLDAVPLDILDAAGSWSYEYGVLALTEGTLNLEDREQVDRFRTLVARDARLTLEDNAIVAEALLREPNSDRAVVDVEIAHDLASGVGSADLAVYELRFDERLQPAELTPLALGVIANADGIVRGSGRIEWNATDVTSTGAFTSDGFDFAAAFGPVRGASGTVRFTDLLDLVTAPDQQLTLHTINPGIEVYDGVITFQLEPDYILNVKGAKWPFLGGTLTLLPVRLNMGVAETRRYDLVIEGLDAGRFVEQMDLGNLAATGTFDGEMPLVFTEDGGFVEGGVLRARPPGGNVSYVGQLTYKDLSAMANFAFDALRSLDYRTMTIGLDGAIDGEMVTRVKFTGVSQGEGASSNFVTRQVARLPIQFNVNLRAPFFQLITSVKSFYDPAYVRDPRTLGLLGAEGQPFRTGQPMPPAVHPAESGDMP